MTLLFFLLKHEHFSFSIQTEGYQGCTTYFSNGLGGGTTHFQLTNGVTDRVNAHCTKGKSNVGQKYKSIIPGQYLTSYFEELRQILMSQFSLHGHDDNVCNKIPPNHEARGAGHVKDL